MTIGSSRFDRRISNLTIFTVSAAVAVAVAVLAWQPDLDAAPMSLSTGALNTGTTGPVALSPHCREADRAAVAQLAALLERNGPADAPILERAVYTLNLARRHCLYDWEGRGLDDYQWLNRWLGQHNG